MLTLPLWLQGVNDPHTSPFLSRDKKKKNRKKVKKPNTFSAQYNMMKDCVHPKPWVVWDF